MFVAMHQKLALLSIVSLDYGGAQRQLLELAKHLQQRGWMVHVCCINDDLSLLPEFDAAKIQVTCLYVKTNFSGIVAPFRFYSLLRRTKPGILVGFSYHANLFVKVVGLLAGVNKRITSIRNVHFGGKFRDFLERITFSLSDATVVNSFCSAKELEMRNVVPKGKSIVIRNAVRFSSKQLASPNRIARRDTFRWIAVGRLVAAKGYPYLFESIRTLAGSGCNLNLTIAGEGGDGRQLAEMVNNLGISNFVQFVGRVENILPLIQVSDAIVMPSEYEGLPNALLEAVFLGKPAVATRVGGIPEIVRDGVNGFLVPPRDAVALAQKMKVLMELDTESFYQMGEAGRAYIAKEFDPENILMQWEELCTDTGHAGKY